jgi:hypothetical protein
MSETEPHIGMPAQFQRQNISQALQASEVAADDAATATA